MVRGGFVELRAVRRGPGGIAKRYMCAAKSFDARLSVVVASLLRTLRIAKTTTNVSSDRSCFNAFG